MFTAQRIHYAHSFSKGTSRLYLGLWTPEAPSRPEGTHRQEALTGEPTSDMKHLSGASAAKHGSGWSRH